MLEAWYSTIGYHRCLLPPLVLLHVPLSAPPRQQEGKWIGYEDTLSSHMRKQDDRTEGVYSTRVYLTGVASFVVPSLDPVELFLSSVYGTELRDFLISFHASLFAHPIVSRYPYRSCAPSIKTHGLKH